MRKHTEQFKTKIKEFGRQLDSKLTFGETELGNEQLNAVTPVLQSALLKSVMKELDIDSNVDIPIGTVVNYKLGVLLDNDTYEYIDYGNYIIYSSEKQEDTNSYNIVAYDKMLYSMTEYRSIIVSYPITIRDYLKEICLYLDIDFASENDEFANYNREIPNELYLDEDGNSLDYTFRDVLDEIAQATGSNIIINENDELEVKYVTDTNDVIDEEYLKDINVKFGEKYGPINSIVLSRAGGSDNIYLQDEESIEQNGLCELKISDNQLMNFNDRSDYLPGLLNKLNGLEYFINDFSSTGICYYETADRYGVKIGENIYTCIMFNDEQQITQGLEENIHTDMPEETETDYTKSDKTDRKINQTYIIVNKQTGQIEALTSQTNTIQDSLTNNYYTIEQSNQQIQDAINGITNILTQKGGTNILKNSIGDFNYDYWEGEGASSYTDTYVQNKTGQRSCWLLNNGTHLQTNQVKNGTYTLSFMYEKLIDLANVTLKINNTEYEITEETEITFDVTNNHITIEFTGDTDKCAYLMNLMLNEGEVAQVYSHNIDEAVSDTVKIGKGIQIQATGINTMFDAQADGIRLKNINSGATSTEFTDKGTTTNELTANKATIAKVLINDIGEQTLFTRI